MRFAKSDSELDELIAAMTVNEKVDLVSGQGLWRTAVNYRLNIPETVMTDGTNGLRYSADQIDGGRNNNNGLTQFLELLNKSKDGSGEATFGSTMPATCFPSGSAVGCSWDPELLYRMGSSLAAECQHYGINLLLGPGINIRRTPLAGRAYEYYSEDPLVNGILAAALIRGLQDNGVGACLKHFACNNSEIERTTMSSDVDDRALREIYLAGFEMVIAQVKPWVVMSSYNRVNGEQVSHSRFLLTQVLREEWHFDGLVVSDWFAIKDRAKSLIAGNDLDMPESAARKGELINAVAGGVVSLELLDRACKRVLRYVVKAKTGENRGVEADFASHHQIARALAAESLVLAKNAGGALPLLPGTCGQVLVLGSGAVRPVIQGSGSATTRPTELDVPLEALRRALGFDNVLWLQDSATNNPALETAIASAGAVVIFANTVVQSDGEGADRVDLRIDARQEQLISHVAARHSRVVVVLSCPDAVEMPWLDDIEGLLIAFFPGQGGGQAIAEVLSGKVNPSGKLTTSFPARMEDIPGYHTYPGENGRHAYSESIFVGYRYYDLKRMVPALPFGHGLSYTSFEYRDLVIDGDVASTEACPVVEFSLCNTGSHPGKEVVQLYIRPVKSGLKRPVRELKKFAKVALQPGECRKVRFALTLRDFQYWDSGLGRWILRAQAFFVELGASSRDLRLVAEIGCVSDPTSFVPIERDTQPTVILANPRARDELEKLLTGELSISIDEAQRILELCRDSFLGLEDTLNWFIGERVPSERIRDTIRKINALADFRPPVS